MKAGSVTFNGNFRPKGLRQGKVVSIIDAMQLYIVNLDVPNLIVVKFGKESPSGYWQKS